MIKIPKALADFGLQLNRLYYKQLLQTTYLQSQQMPSWFDHRIDLYYHWPHNLFWLERGVFPRKHMVEGCLVLDLFCGDGFFSHYFYATIAGHIDAIDKSPQAIAHAQKWHSHPKINYLVQDVVLQDFPRPHYDVIVWFEAIEHLSQADYEKAVGRIKSALGDTGVLIGSTPLVPPDKLGQANWEHQNEFSEVQQLHTFLARDFEQIQIDVTIYPIVGGGQRQTAYFTLKQPK